jgi:hypothetical protein
MPSEPLLRIGDRDKSWEVELRIPRSAIGQVVSSLAATGERAELDVDLVLACAPTRSFRGKLTTQRLAAEAVADVADTSTAGTAAGECVVHAVVRIDGDDIAEAERIPQELLISGTEVRARIHCGERSLGYCLFHGLWEFICAKSMFLR